MTKIDRPVVKSVRLQSCSLAVMMCLQEAQSGEWSQKRSTHEVWNYPSFPQKQPTIEWEHSGCQDLTSELPSKSFASFQILLTCHFLPDFGKWFPSWHIIKLQHRTKLLKSCQPMFDIKATIKQHRCKNVNETSISQRWSINL